MGCSPSADLARHFHGLHSGGDREAAGRPFRHFSDAPSLQGHGDVQASAEPPKCRGGCSMVSVALTPAAERHYTCARCGGKSKDGHLGGSKTRRWRCFKCDYDVCFQCHPCVRPAARKDLPQEARDARLKRVSTVQLDRSDTMGLKTMLDGHLEDLDNLSLLGSKVSAPRGGGVGSLGSPMLLQRRSAAHDMSGEVIEDAASVLKKPTASQVVQDAPVGRARGELDRGAEVALPSQDPAHDQMLPLHCARPLSPERSCAAAAAADGAVEVPTEPIAPQQPASGKPRRMSPPTHTETPPKRATLLQQRSARLQGSPGAGKPASASPRKPYNHGGGLVPDAEFVQAFETQLKQRTTGEVRGLLNSQFQGFLDDRCLGSQQDKDVDATLLLQTDGISRGTLVGRQPTWLEPGAGQPAIGVDDIEVTTPELRYSTPRTMCPCTV